METSTKIKKRTQIEISFHHFFLRIQTKIHQFSNYENQAQLWKLSQESTMKNLAMKHHEKPSYENEDLTNPLNPNWTTTGQQIKTTIQAHKLISSLNSTNINSTWIKIWYHKRKQDETMKCYEAASETKEELKREIED